MVAPSVARIDSVVRPVVEAQGLELEEVVVTTAGRRRSVRVVVDSDDGAALDAVAQVSREVSEVLDTDDLMGDLPYVLEVSSPGVDRPLTTPRHWRRAIGRLVEVRTTAGDVLTGRAVSVDDDATTPTVELVVEVPGAKKGMPTRTAERTLRLDEVERAQVQVEFNREPDAIDGTDGSAVDES